MAAVSRLHLEGFKSIRRMDLELTALNVLIGINGSGKSNLVSFFDFLNFAMTKALQHFIELRAGGGHALLFNGPKTTPVLKARVEFRTDQGTNAYDATFAYAANDTLVFTDETVEFKREGFAGGPERQVLGAGHKESQLAEADPTRLPASCRIMKSFLNRCRSFQFHDTSLQSNIRQNSRTDDSRPLLSDAGNLASVLFRLRTHHPEEYTAIRDAVRIAAPWFDDFVLLPFGLSDSFVKLRWKEKDSPIEFHAHAASDGTLRFIALSTLLSQPNSDMPSLVVIDEPELGLHPLAIDALAELVKRASTRCQVLLSTQSMQLVEALGCDPIVVNRVSGASVFERRTPWDLDQWLDEYTIGKLWETRR